MMTIQRNQSAGESEHCNSGLHANATPWVPRADAKPWVPRADWNPSAVQPNANAAAAAAWELQQLELERRLRQLELEGFNNPMTQTFKPPKPPKKSKSERRKERKAKADEVLLQRQQQMWDWQQFCAAQKGESINEVIPHLKQYACLAEGCNKHFGKWTTCLDHMRNECGWNDAATPKKQVRRESAAKVNKLFRTDPAFVILRLGTEGVQGFESEEAAYQDWLDNVRSRNRRKRAEYFELDFDSFVDIYINGDTKDDNGNKYYSTRLLRREGTQKHEGALNHITLEAWKAQQQESLA